MSGIVRRFGPFLRLLLVGPQSKIVFGGESIKDCCPDTQEGVTALVDALERTGRVAFINRKWLLHGRTLRAEMIVLSENKQPIAHIEIWLRIARMNSRKEAIRDLIVSGYATLSSECRLTPEDILTMARNYLQSVA